MSWRSQPVVVAILILVAIVAMILWVHNFHVSADELSQLFPRLHLGPLVPLFALLVGHVALSAWRWSLIEVGLGGARPSFRDSFITGAFALGLGTFLPHDRPLPVAVGAEVSGVEATGAEALYCFSRF